MYKIECKNIIEFDKVNQGGRIWSKSCIETSVGKFPIKNITIGYYTDELGKCLSIDEDTPSYKLCDENYKALGTGDLVYNAQRNSVDLVNGLIESLPGVDLPCSTTLDQLAVSCDGNGQTVLGHRFLAITDIMKDSFKLYLCNKSSFEHSTTTITKIESKDSKQLSQVKQYCIENFHAINDKRKDAEYEIDSNRIEDDDTLTRIWGDKRMFDGELFILQNIISYIDSLNRVSSDKSAKAEDADWYKHRMEDYRTSFFNIVESVRKLSDNVPEKLKQYIEDEAKKY